jgi:cytochrome c-type biogenesis protein CcmF
MLNFVTRPFDMVAAIPADGQDLNPLLQNYWMAIHPPSLYTGYVSQRPVCVRHSGPD